MFDISIAELFLVVLVAVVFIGPKELPTVIRAIAKMMRVVKGLSHEIKKTFDDLAQESGLKDEMDAMDREIKMIQGDDGNWYESYQPKKPAVQESGQ
jgi:sec-independent protein translocase protein TatB